MLSRDPGQETPKHRTGSVSVSRSCLAKRYFQTAVRVDGVWWWWVRRQVTFGGRLVFASQTGVSDWPRGPLRLPQGGGGLQGSAPSSFILAQQTSFTHRGLGTSSIYIRFHLNYMNIFRGGLFPLDLYFVYE